jgi:carboxyl-terminal processing protease
MLDNDVGYLVLQRFNENAAQQVENAVESLHAKGAKSYIIDVRGNPGGSLDQSLEIGNLFLKPGVEIASVRHRGKTPEIYKANRPSIIDSASVVVLVDQYSASASGDRGRRAAGPGSRAGRRPAVVRQGTGADALPARGRLGDQAHDRQVVHAERALDPGRAQAARGRALRGIRAGFSRERLRPAARGRSSSRLPVAWCSAAVASRPDVLVKSDTITTPGGGLRPDHRRPRPRSFYNQVFAYARELRERCKYDFTVQPAWRDELYRRLVKSDVRSTRKLYDRRAAGTSTDTRTPDRDPRVRRFRRVPAQHPGRPQLLTAIEYTKKARTQRDMLALAAKEGNNQ